MLVVDLAVLVVDLLAELVVGPLAVLEVLLHRGELLSARFELPLVRFSLFFESPFAILRARTE